MKPTKQELRGKDEDLKVFAQHFEKLIVENDLLYYTACVNYVGDNDTVRRVVVPRDYMDNVFYWCHEHETAGHFGEKGTIARAKAKFYYPGMAASLQRMVKACKSCLAKITKVNLKKGQVTVAPEERDVVQHMALAFVTTTLYLLVQPRPKNLPKATKRGDKKVHS